MIRWAEWPTGRKVFVGSVTLVMAPLLAVLALLYSRTSAGLDPPPRARLTAAAASLAGEVEAAARAALAEHLRVIADQGRQTVAELHGRVTRGELTADQARQEAATRLAGRRLGPAGHLYAIDGRGVVQAHPEAASVGRALREVDGFAASREFVDRQLERKNGYLEETEAAGRTVRPRGVALVAFAPWDWIIAALCPLDSWYHLVDLQPVVDRLATLPLEVGSAFLLDDRGGVLVHPRPTAAAELAAQRQAILAAVDGSNLATSRWQDADGAEHRQVLAFRRLPAFGLIVGVAADDRSAPFLSVRTLLLLAGLAATLFALGAAFFLGHHIGAPLRRLAAELGPADGGGHGAETDLLLTRCRQAIVEARESAERLQAEAQRRHSAESFLKLYRQIFDSVTEGIMITDAEARILTVNNAFTTITGYPAHEAVGRNPRLLRSDRQDAAFYEKMWQSLAEQGNWAGEIWNRSRDGALYPQWLSIHCVRDEQNNVRHYFASFYELGELKRRERQVAFLAYHDALTRLPNRTFLENRLARVLSAHGGDSGRLLALFFIDLDNFKNVNDVFGHRQGDELLVQVAQRLKTVLGGNDSLHRLSSDEFLLLMEQVENEAVLYLMANRILAALKNPFTLEFRKIYVNASIGISRFPGDGDTPMELIRSADMAMHRAKAEGKNRYQLFTRGMHEQLYERFRTENGIRYGLLHREFVVYYQPKVAIATRTTTSLEALIRWQKGGRLINPGVFIPVAEESSLIDDLCRYVLEATCQFHAVMQRHGVAVPVSVNISPRQFLNIDFVDLVEDLLGRHRMDPHYLELEVTETTAMKDVEHTLRIMERIRRLGIRFSIDDFGSGYSSLGYLNRMPVSTLKIDKQFVQDLERHSGIVATIIAISQQMHLNVVAEGVETEAQLLGLAAMGCHEAQGYYFSRPVADTDILRYLAGECAAAGDLAGGAPGAAGGEER